MGEPFITDTDAELAAFAPPFAKGLAQWAAA